MLHSCLVWSLVLVAPAPVADADAPKAPAPAAARALLQQGKYDEALEAFEAIRKAEDAAPAARARAAIGRADALAAQGKYDEALAGLKSFVAAEPKAAAAWARLAELRLDRGDRAGADEAAGAALEVEPDQLLARFVRARLAAAKGQEADWRWFIEHYNAHHDALDKDADALLIVGQAAERYYRAHARKEELAEGLNDVINSLYEGALKADEDCWRAAWLEGRLFLEGYREGSAKKELQRALLINPAAAEVLVTLGVADLQGYKLAAGREKVERALEINPHYGPAYTLLADLNISDERFTEALEAAKKAVAEDPTDLEALGRLAAASRLVVDAAGAWAAEAAALALNPRPVAFYNALAERLADRRKYQSAERAFLLAIAADPEDGPARLGLGMLYMQVGREAEAGALFDAAFAADPFNVRANNMMLVLKHLASYTPVETEHFRVLVDPTQDTLLGRYMARFLEQSYKDLTERFGYAPPGVTQVEILKDHNWFSGRTVALPFIPTVGACTGKVVALASTKGMKKPFNWSRVLTHEVTHVITLQQTDFNIPHWYTEALAVESEGTPRPQEWNKMLLARVPTRKGLLNLDNVNLGFIRPKEPEERQLAYCQSQLYARYMLKRFGDDALKKMLDAYRRGLTTGAAINACFGVTKEDFEGGYLDYLDEVVKTIRTRVAEEEPVPLSKLQRQLEEKPDDAGLNARMAYEHFARRDYKAARPFADKALKLRPNQPLAAYVKARLFVTIGDSDAALALLEPALDPEKPNERVVDLLAELQMKAGRLDEAERLYELARRDDPYHTKWIAGLARVHLRQKDEAKFLDDLAKLAANDSDDLSVRQALAERHLKAGRAEEAEKWATECLYIDVYDPSHHATLADAQAAQGEFAPAVEEYETALSLKVKKPDDVRVRLARSLAGLGRRDEARAMLDDILKRAPGHPEAKAFHEELKISD